MAALLKTNNDFFCGGTVISSRKVTTAAHCIHDKRTKEKLLSRDFNVALGTYDLEELFEVGRTIHAVKTIHVHDDWNIYTDSYDADIAVLVMEHEIIFNLFIQPICFLSTDSKLINATEGIVVGYGKSEVKFIPHETVPKVIETPIWNHRNCFEDDKDLAWLSSGRTFCGGSGSGVGVCKGDSGSGLFVSDGYNYYIRGIVSSSLKNVKNDCDVDTYAVYTDVVKFTSWINGI